MKPPPLTVTLLICAISYVATAEILAKEEVSDYITKHNSEHPGKQENDLPKHLTPTNYKLKLQPLGHEGLFQRFKGQVNINISCHEDTDIITLHAHHDIEILLVDTVIHKVGQEEKAHETSSFIRIEDTHHYQRILPATPLHSVRVIKLNRNSNNDKCELILSEELKKGMMYQLKLEFSSNMSTLTSRPFHQEFYEDHSTKERRWYMALDMTSHKARRVFPCFDEKHFKATFELSIIRPEKMRVIATMPLSSTESVVHRAGWKIDHFKRTPPMSVNGLSAVIFDPRSLLPVPPKQISEGVTVRGYAHSTLLTSFQSLMDKVTQTVRKLQSYIGIPFPLPELYLLAIPQEKSHGHSWGIIRFSDKIVSEDFLDSLIFNDIVDQWTEYLITPHSIEDGDLAIGLRVFITCNSLKEMMSTEHMIGLKAIFEKLFYDLGFTDVSQKNFTAYKTILSAMVIRMFNYTLTEKTLKKALYSFIRERTFKTFTEDDFFEALDNQAWLDGILPVAISTRDIAKSWTEKRRFPVVTVMRNYGSNTATLEQHTFFREWPHTALNETNYSWWIPLMYLTRPSLEVNTFMTFGWMKDKRITINNLPRRDTFIIMNPENIGLFMVNYDETNWHLLSVYLIESVSGQRQLQIPAGTRSKLLYDAIYLAEGEELDFDIALDMTLFIKHERDPLVWDTVFDVFDELKRILQNTTVLHKFLIYMRHMFLYAFETFDIEMEADTLIALGYEPLLAKARAKFHASLGNNTALNIPTEILCSVFRWSDEDWNLGLKQALYIHTSDESVDQSIFLLSILAECTNNPENINRILTIVLLERNNTFTTGKEEIMESILDYPTSIKFISHHFNSIESRFGTKPQIWNKIFEEAMKDIKTQEGFELISDLWQMYQNKMGSAQKVVENSMQRIKENVFGRYRYISVIDAWLDKQLLILSIQ